MKKSKYKIILAALIMAISIMPNSETNSQEKFSAQKTNFVTEKVPDDITKYAKDVFEMLIDKECLTTKSKKLHLCKPFLTNSKNSIDIYKFLIKDDKEVISSLMIINDKNAKSLKWQLNEGKTLNNIKEKISKGGTYKLSIKKTNSEDISELVFEEVSDKSVKSVSSITDEISTVEIKKDNITLREVDYPLPYPDERILYFNPKEVQINNSWCAAYVGATILSHGMGKDIRAYNIMRWAYPNMKYSSLLETGISDSKLISYAKSVGSNPYYVNYALTRTEIMDEIIAKRMIYAGCKNVYRNSFHAMLVYGYKKDVSYKVWNPWGEYYTIPMSSSDIYADDDSHYYWTDSIKNWTD